MQGASLISAAGVTATDQQTDAPMRAAGTIGPNSVIQLAAAVTDALGRVEAERLFEQAGLSDLLRTPPETMIAETLPAALFRALWRLHPVAAPRLAADAGRRTADYVIAHRIPRFARVIFFLAPRWLSVRLLLMAIRKNAWTFAGSGQCTVTTGKHPIISIRDNPLAMPDGTWHTAVFQRLFERLVAKDVQVRYTGGDDGGGICSFEIAWLRS